MKAITLQASASILKGPLVIVPCGQEKIWDKKPDLGPVPARDVYTGAPFKVNREYAEIMVKPHSHR